MASVFGLALPLVLALLGVALIVLEAVSPGAHFTVIGAALLAAGIAGLLVPELADPLPAAVIVLVVGAATLFVYRRFDVYGAAGEPQTSDSGTLVGQRGTVTERVTPESGRVHLRGGGFDPTFSARTVEGEIPEGRQVRVVDGGGGSVLTVEPVSESDGNA